MEHTFSLRLCDTHRQGAVTIHGVYGEVPKIHHTDPGLFCLFVYGFLMWMPSVFFTLCQMLFILQGPVSAPPPHQVFSDCASWCHSRSYVVQDLAIVSVLELVSQLAQGRHYTHLILWGPCSPNKVLKIVGARGFYGSIH